MEKLRIIMFSDFYGYITTTFIRNEVYALARKHFFTYLTCRKLVEEADVEIVELSYKPSLPVRKFYWWLWQMDIRCLFYHLPFSEKLNHQLHRLNPEVIHLQFGFEAIKFLQNTQSKIPTLIHFHGYDASEMLRKKSYTKEIKKYLKQSHITAIFVSEYMAQKFLKLTLTDSHYHVLRCGIDLSLFHPSQRKVLSGSRKVFLQISSLAPKKGHEFTIRALRKAFDVKPDIRGSIVFKFAGDGKRKTELNNLVLELGLQDDIEFIGNKNTKEVIELLLSSHYFVHHSITDESGDEEGIPTSVMEAMSMELPILSTYHAGIPELVQHGVNGLLCAEKDVDTFAKQIIEMLSWSFLPANRKVIEEQYSLDLHMKQLEEIYRIEITRHQKKSLHD
ncbi:MAG: glycosyltransferase [Bacteroidota bacterium]|jgi:colanic acid/amylovoran biosynthesis glycosyltransferase